MPQRSSEEKEETKTEKAPARPYQEPVVAEATDAPRAEDDPRDPPREVDYGPATQFAYDDDNPATLSEADQVAKQEEQEKLEAKQAEHLQKLAKQAEKESEK